MKNIKKLKELLQVWFLIPTRQNKKLCTSSFAIKHKPLIIKE